MGTIIDCSSHQKQCKPNKTVEWYFKSTERLKKMTTQNFILGENNLSKLKAKQTFTQTKPKRIWCQQTCTRNIEGSYLGKKKMKAK